jgi:hypothetical protein
MESTAVHYRAQYLWRNNDTSERWHGFGPGRARVEKTTEDAEGTEGVGSGQKNQSVVVAVAVVVADLASLATRSKDRDFRQAHLVLVDGRHPAIVVAEPQPD